MKCLIYLFTFIIHYICVFFVCFFAWSLRVTYNLRVVFTVVDLHHFLKIEIDKINTSL